MRPDTSFPASPDSENAPFAALAALEFGLPLIGERDRSCRPATPARWADAIMRVIEDPAGARERVERGGAHMREYFGLPRLVAQLVGRDVGRHDFGPHQILRRRNCGFMCLRPRPSGAELKGIYSVDYFRNWEK